MTDRRLYGEDGTTPLNADPGDTDPLYVDGSYGDVALAPVIAGDGFELVDATAAVTLALQVAASGFQLDTGTGAITLGLAIAASGTVTGGEEVPTTAGPTLRRIYIPQPAPAFEPEPVELVQVVIGVAAVRLALSVRATGYVNDDDLALLLAA
jgi:hypothetical protein